MCACACVCACVREDPWSSEAWAALQGPLLPPDDPRVSLEAALQAGSLGVDVTASGVAGRAAASAAGTSPAGAAT
eukprot:6745278-Alexandrium_andersonii.AAC.1